MASAAARPLGRSVAVCVRSLVLVAALAGCTETNMVGPDILGSNIPAVGMNDGQFGFAIMAHDWTSDKSYAPELTSSALDVGLVVIGYTGGTGAVTITDAGGSSVFSQDLAGNIAEGGPTTVHGTAPFHVRLTTSHYSGTISLGIGPTAAPAGARRR